MRGGAAWGRERVRTFWVWGCLDDVLEAHVGDVVYVYLVLEDDDECLAVELDGEDGGGEEELADHGLALRGRGRGSAANTRRSVGAYFCVDDLELARAGRGLVGGAHEGDERRAEEHLDDAARAVVCGRELAVSAAGEGGESADALIV